MVYLVKIFRNLFSGEDDDLAVAYRDFHRAVDHGKSIIQYLLLRSVEQVRESTSELHNEMSVSIAMRGRTNRDINILLGDTGFLRHYLSSRCRLNDLLPPFLKVYRERC